MDINGDTLNTMQWNGCREIEAGSGAIISLYQNVAHNFTASGNIIVLHQVVSATATGAIINLCQDVNT